MSTRHQPPPNNIELRVPLDDVVRFVRQLSHDLRNHLNAAELQAAFMNEIAEDPEVKEEVGRLRSILSEMGGSLQRLSSSLAQPRLTQMRYEADSFVEDLRQKLGAQFPEQNSLVDWEIKTDGAALEIDPQVLQQAALELFANAFQHDRAEGRISATAIAADGEFEFTLREPKTAPIGSTENWGREPFRHIKHGHYGVGLHRVRRIIEAHGGALEAQFDPATSSLATRILLPVASE
jgi:K+-sensing histidine kinase KdpD